MSFKQIHKTAVLVFANSSHEELKHKKIRNGELLFDALTKHILKTVEATEIPFFHFTEELQVGDSFGVRFSNAIQSVFDLGYDSIITVGNDSPHLTKTHILEAQSAINRKQSVIGPSADGGFYLMGLHRTEFEKEVFKKLSWQTSKVFEEVSDLFSVANREYSQLPRLFDIDSIYDVETIAKYLSGLSQSVLKVIQFIISLSKKAETPSFTYPIGLYYQVPSNKGSPFTSLS